MRLSNVRPITELKRDAAGIIDEAAEQGSAIVITQNGRATAVLQDVETYEAQRRELAMLKLVVQGEQQVRAGRGLSLDGYRAGLAGRLGRTRTG